MSVHSGITTASVDSILGVLNEIARNFPPDEYRYPDDNTAYTKWHGFAMWVLCLEISRLSRSPWDSSPTSQMRLFPKQELDGLHEALGELVKGKYSLDKTFPVLICLNENDCLVSYEELERHKHAVPPPFPPCAQVLINIQLDTIGEHLCADAHGHLYTVQQYVDFAKRTQWVSLREYLLAAVSCKWSQRASSSQYRVLRDLILVRKASENKSIDAFWMDLQDVYLVRPQFLAHCCKLKRHADYQVCAKGPNDPDRKYRHLIKVLVKYDRARAHGGWPLYEDRDIEEESPAPPSLNSRQIHDLAPRQTHARLRSRSLTDGHRPHESRTSSPPTSHGGPAAEMSLRKQVVYGYRV
ncbi:hypothetical protein JCM5353_008680 [Sporobolomyces roseus]